MPDLLWATSLPALRSRCAGLAERPTAALVRDLKPRGMLDPTLVIGASSFDPERFTYRSQSLDFKLTGFEGAKADRKRLASRAAWRCV